MIFLFFGEKGERGMEWERVNVKEGFEGLYQMGDKSGIWRFYRRVWKNIFYERRDKERFWGVFGMEREKGRAKLYFFKIF